MYYSNNRDNGGCLVALIFFIIILIVVAYFAWWIIVGLLCILGIVGTGIGAIITLRNYIVSLGHSISSYSHAMKPVNWTLIPTFFYRFVKINWTAIVETWHYNIGNIKSFFTVFSGSKLFSMKKWFFFFAGISVAIFGTLMTAFILFFLLYIIYIVFMVILFLILAACSIFLLIGLGTALFFTTKNYISAYKDSYYGARTTFMDYILSYGYREYMSVLGDCWRENLTRMENGFYSFKTEQLLSFKKWIGLGGAVMIITAGTVLTGIFALLHIIYQSVLFGIFKLISLFKK